MLASANLPGSTTPYLVEFKATGSLNRNPVFTFPDEIIAYEGDILRIPIIATDPDGDAVFLTPIPINLPDSSVYGKNPDGVDEFSWNISYHTLKLPTKEKLYYPEFFAQDSKAGKTKKTLKLTVKNVNRAPVLSNPIPQKLLSSSLAGIPLTFSISAFDPDFDAMTFSWTNNVSPVGINDSTFTWNIPGDISSGTYEISVRVSDGETSSIHSWSIKTKVNLSSFNTLVKEYTGVIIEWETASETNNMGFNILRSNREDGDYEKINSALIAKRKDKKYRFIDADVEAATKYYYKLEDVELSGHTSLHGPVVAEVGVPDKFELSQNYPNPFNPTTSIRFSLPKVAKVQLEIYNIMGQRVRALIDDSRKAGYHVVLWDGMNDTGNRVGSGIYYYRIIAEDFVLTKKMILLK